MATVSTNRGFLIFVMLIGVSVMGLSKISSIAKQTLDGVNIDTIYGTAISARLTGDYLRNAYESFNNSTRKEGRQEQHDVSCPEGLIMFQNKMVESSNTTTASRIPRTLHFFSKSKCLPKEAHDNLQKWSDAIPNYSIVLHDLQDISTHLSKPRKDLPFVANALKCAFSHEAVLDLARFVYLYDYGGISTDINQLPAEGMIKFADGTMRSMQDEYYIELEAEYPRFIAAAPRSVYIYINMQLSIANQYQQFSFNKTSEELYNQNRNSVYQLPFAKDSFATRSEAHVLVQRNPQPGFNGSNAIYSSRLPNGFLIHSPMSDMVMERIRLGEAFDTNGREEVFKQCVDFTDTSYRVDYEDLIQVAGGSNAKPKIPCPTNLTFQVNSFAINSTTMSSNGTRKIPKIVHMTSKGRCFTKAFADNIKQWTLPGYSFVLHDDEAVEKLFHNYEWTEFPLLRHVLTCLTSGAMKADLWRYLALWKWGGVYTDMDNAPGREWFKEGTFINDNMDAMFEVERGGFPSQYFYAISPHHPASYFMVSATIQRIIFNDKPMLRHNNIPVLTGPGALKNALIMSFGGNGYPTEGEYIGRSNRSMTMLGSRIKAKRSIYVGRCLIRNAAIGDEEAMNMTHYLDKSSRTNVPKHSCRVQLMKETQVIADIK